MAPVQLKTVGGYNIQREENHIQVCMGANNIVFSINLLNCCGVKEISSLKYATEILGISKFVHQLAEMKYVGRLYNCAFYLFTEVQPSSAYSGGSYGADLKAFILEHKLGAVTESNVLVNPNSNNPLKAYIWEIDHDRLKAFHGVPLDVSVTTPPQIPPVMPRVA